MHGLLVTNYDAIYDCGGLTLVETKLEPPWVLLK